MDVSGYQQLFGYQNSSKYLLCSQQKTEIHPGLEHRE